MGAYRGSRGDKVQGLCGLSDVAVVMRNKRIRWASSVYARYLPELREIALREVLEDDVEMMWIQGADRERGTVRVAPLDKGKVEEWSDGSRAEERAVGATRTRGLYLGGGRCGGGWGDAGVRGA